MEKKQAFVWLFSCLIVCSIASVTLWFVLKEEVFFEQIAERPEPAPQEKNLAETFEKILFSPHLTKPFVSIPNFYQELEVTYLPPKPGILEGQLEMSIQGSEKTENVVWAKPIYFGYQRLGNSFEYALRFQNKSDFFLQPLRYEDGYLLLQAHLDPKGMPINDDQGKIWRLPVQKRLYSSPTALQTISGVFPISQGSYLGDDLFESEFNCKKVSWISSAKGDVLRVEEGECFVRSRDIWTKAISTHQCENRPVLRIKAIDSTQVICEAWDASGQKYAGFSLRKQASSPFSYPTDQLIKEVYIKTPRKVELSLESFRLTMRQGDWAVKTANQWRVVRSDEKIEQLIEKYPTFFLERIYKKQRKKWLSGKLYAPLRMAYLPIQIEILYKNHKHTRQQLTKKTLKRSPR